jgi:hypothetical protein
MIEAGRYKARGVEAALGVTGTGKEQVAVLVEVTDGPAKGEQLTWYGFFTDATVERTFESLRYLGWSGDDLTDLRGIDANEVTIIVEHETGSDNKVRPRVKWINAPGGGLAMKDKMPENAARAFAQRMRGFAVASRNKAPKAAPANGTRPARPAPQNEPSPFDDEPPPF